MTHDRTLVHNSWKRLQSAGPVFAGLFHHNLQRKNSHMQPATSHSSHQLELKFMAAIDSFLKTVPEKTPAHHHTLWSLYHYHGNLQQCADDFRHTFLLTLEQLLGQDFCADTQRVWQDVLHHLHIHPATHASGPATNG